MADDFNPYSAPQSTVQPVVVDEGSGLKSLGQEARTTSLNQARWTMIIIGLLTAVLNVAAQFNVQHQIAEIERRGGMADPDEVLEASITNIGFAAVGVLFVVMGIIIHKFPVPITIAALVIYVCCTVIAFVLNPMMMANVLAIVFRVAIIMGFWKSVQSAKAYEQERRMSPYDAF